MADSNDVYMKDASRGKKMIRSTGHDGSSYGDTGTKSLKGDIKKGGTQDISSSIVDGKVRKH